MEILKVVADNLIKARGVLSRKELAGMAHVSYQHIYEIEEEIKNPSLKVLGRVADALDKDLAWFLKDHTGQDDEAEPRKEPVSRVLQRMMAIPDEVYDLALSVPKNDEAWGTAIDALKIAQKRLGVKNTNHA